MPEAQIASFREQILHAAKQKMSLSIRGGGSKAWYGNPNPSAILETKNYSGILDYQAEELVITARAGTPLSEIEAVLASKNQTLPFDPPHFDANSTFGGMIAAGLAGPSQISSGKVSHFILGTRIMSGSAEDLSFGGKVMKNVAGYDVSRLLAGSMGTLSLLLEASLKVLPKPAAEQTLRGSITQERALQLLNQWAGKPLPINASTWIGPASQGEGELNLRLSGAKATVQSAGAMISEAIHAKELEPNEAKLFWQGIRNQTLPWFQNLASEEALWRLSLPANCPELAFPNNGNNQICLEWHGQQRWWRGPVDSHTHTILMKLAQEFGGHATCFRVNSDDPLKLAMQRFSLLKNNPLTAPLEIIQERLRKAFDPHGVFNTGRLP